VSFKNITFEEGTATAVADGYLSVYNGRVHPIGPVITVGPGNASTGSQLNGLDTVSNWGLGPPYAIGRFPVAHPLAVRGPGSLPGQAALGLASTAPNAEHTFPRLLRVVDIRGIALASHV
jgi:hypothetical protein